MNELVRNLLLSTFKIILLGICSFTVFYFSFKQYKEWEMYKTSQIPPFVDDGICNIVTVPISGTIGIGATNAYVDEAGVTATPIPLTGDVDRVIHDLEYVKNYPGINAVVLQVDSYGGMGNADEVLLSYLKKYPKPVVTLVRDTGASMGYSVGLASKRIFAYPNAMVGSIGVNSSYVANSEKNKKEGLEYISIVSGKFKDTGTPDKELSKEELAYLQEMNDKNYERFIDLVSTYRDIPREKVKELADGRMWYADEAKDLQLIDQVGDIDDVSKWIEQYWSDNGTPGTAIPCAQY